MTAKRIRAILVTGALAAALGCASTPSEPEPEVQRRSTGEVVDDSIVTAKVKSALVADPTTKAYQIQVQTLEGVVQLSGFVDDPASIERAEQVAQSVEGVRRVENDLKLRE